MPSEDNFIILKNIFSISFEESGVNLDASVTYVFQGKSLKLLIHYSNAIWLSQKPQEAALWRRCTSRGYVLLFFNFPTPSWAQIRRRTRSCIFLLRSVSVTHVSSVSRWIRVRLLVKMGCCYSSIPIEMGQWDILIICN